MLTVQPGGLVFDAAISTYEVSVGNATDTVTVTAGPAVAGSAVRIVPADADSATGHQVALNEIGMYGAGSTTTITVTVTATDTTTTKTYTVDVIRAPASKWTRDASKDIYLPTSNVYLPEVPYVASEHGTGPWQRWRPGGIWSDGTTVWATDGSTRLLPDDQLSDRPMPAYAFNLSTGAREESKDLPDPGDSARSMPGFLWSDNETMWVFDRNGDVLRAVNLSTGAADTAKNFSSFIYPADYSGMSGVWSDGTTLYVTVRMGRELFTSLPTDVRVLAYDFATGNRLPSKDITGLAAAGNKRPDGMWSDGITLWVADAWRVFAYDLATGDRRAHLEFNPSLNWTEPLRDIWSDGRTMWVSYEGARTTSRDFLRAFTMPKTGLLYSLELDGIDVPFVTWRSSYAIDVPAAKTSTTVTAVTAHSDSTVAITPSTDADTNTAGHQVDLSTGANTITVTSTNGGDVRTYTLTITRASS